MLARNLFAAWLGLLFMFTPFWVHHFPSSRTALWSCLLIGFIQFVSSLLAIGKSGWRSWPNWISLMCGIWFVLAPSAYELGLMETIGLMVLALTSVMLNYYNMENEK